MVKYGQHANEVFSQSVWGVKKNIQSEPNSLGLETIGGTSQTAKSQPIANDRANSTGRNNSSALDRIVSKKLIDQLIEDTRDQLEKSNECIDWYIRESKEYEAKLKSLNELRALAESDQNHSPTP